MAMKASILQFEACDKCNVSATAEAPVLQLSGGKGHEKFMVFVHERCLLKLVDKAKKDAAKKELAG